MAKRIEMVGKTCGRLYVKEYVGLNKRHQATYLCDCVCGNSIVTTGESLRRGDTQSCGCLRRDRYYEWVVKNAAEHPKKDKRLYNIWSGMKTRCFNTKDKAYCNYGGRGIVVCDEWKNSFDSFEKWARNNGYSDQLTIERIDVNGNYEPSNCTWITLEEQSKNRRDTRYIEYNGKTQNLTDWCKELNIDEGTMYSRLHSGWSIEKAFSTPVRKRRDTTITYDGKTQPIYMFAKEYGMRPSTLRQRILDYGWPIDKALTEPVDTYHKIQRSFRQ